MRSRVVFVTLLLLVLAAVGIAPAGARPAASGPTQADLYTGTVPQSVIDASAAPGHHWTPEAATYGIGSLIDQPVTMADGKVLRVNVYYPTTASGAAAPGPFPVVLTQTPYGKGGTASATTTEGATGGADVYLVQRGYLDVVADVRGTGDSEGDFDLFAPVQATDGVTLAKYAAALPHSDGKVGLYGPSYLGINQLFTAAAEPKGGPVKAIFPLVAATDVYRDTAFMGGITDFEFGATYLGALTDSLNLANPAVDAIQNPTGDPDVATVVGDHATDVATYNAKFITGIETDGDDAYDDAYWDARQPSSVLAKIVANGIPAYLVGGEFDLFQRGEPLNFASLQDLYDGRPAGAPMTATQPLTGRYQLLDGPFTHLVGSAPKIDALELEWFDTWLKGEDTGMGSTPTPLHYFDLGTNSYQETTRYPIVGETPTRYYLGPTVGGDGALSTNDGSLSTTAPTAARTDRMVWAPTGSPCGRPVDQWSIGAYSYAADSAQVTSQPCTSDDRTTSAGPYALTYTTAAFPAARTLAGPISADLDVTNLTTTDDELVVEVEDVAPDGTAFPLTEGALLGSLRAVDTTASWKDADGSLLLPAHPYTRASKTAVVPGQQTRFQVEVFPTYATIAAGHRIRVTVSSTDTPHLSADDVETAALTGGVYEVHTGTGGPSSVELPLSAAARSGGTSGLGSTSSSGSSGAGARSGSELAFTGLGAGVPLLAAVLLGAGAVAARLRKR